MRRALITAAVLGSLAAAAPATAAAPTDTLLVAAPGAQRLTASVNYVAWLARDPSGGYRLTLRKVDGTITVPDIPKFDSAPRISLGSTRNDRPVVLYSRSYRGSVDVYEYDLDKRRERRVSEISTARSSERAASVKYGRYAFVRSGGPKPGLYVGSGNGPTRRIASKQPVETCFNGSRVSYAESGAVVVRRVATRTAVRLRAKQPIRSVQCDRYYVGWLERGGQTYSSDRISGTVEGDDAVEVDEGRTLPASTKAAAFPYYLDAEGVKEIPSS